MKNLFRILTLITLLLITGLSQAADYSVVRQFVKMVLVFESDGKGGWEERGYGSGVVLAPGYVLTANHVVNDESQKFFVVNNGQKFEAHVVKDDFFNDLALLRVPGVQCPCVELTQRKLELDQELFAVGFPLFSRARVQWVTYGTYQGSVGNRLYSSTHIAPGSSGGGMFSKEGNEYRLIGITKQLVNAPTENQFSSPQWITWMAIATPPEIIRSFLRGTPVQQK